jgi:hypothetical protein
MLAPNEEVRVVWLSIVLFGVSISVSSVTVTKTMALSGILLVRLHMGLVRVGAYLSQGVDGAVVAVIEQIHGLGLGLGHWIQDKLLCAMGLVGELHLWY